MASPRRPYAGRSLLRVVAVLCVLTVVVCGVVLAFFAPADIVPVIAAGLIAAGIGLAVIAGML